MCWSWFEKPILKTEIIEETEGLDEDEKLTNLAVGDMMGGEMIITEVHKARDEGRREGISQGTMQVAEKMIKANKPAKEITMFTDISIDNLKEMAANLGVTLML